MIGQGEHLERAAAGGTQHAERTQLVEQDAEAELVLDGEDLVEWRDAHRARRHGLEQDEAALDLVVRGVMGRRARQNALQFGHAAVLEREDVCVRQAAAGA